MKTKISEILSKIDSSDFYARLDVLTNTNGMNREDAYEQLRIQMACERHAMLRVILMKLGTDPSEMSEAEATLAHR